MIFIGYQGVGKSSLSKIDSRFVDIESDKFSKKGDWPACYISEAKQLESKGYMPFLSSHKSVRELLNDDHFEDVCVIVPSVELKNNWLQKLAIRYSETLKDKDFRALANAYDCFEENIRDIVHDAKQFGWGIVRISEETYNLKYLIDEYLD